MTNDHNCDVTVIGAGPGGYVAAIRAAQLGKKVILVEKWPTLGGTCLNVGCIPSKALLDSSELYARIGHEAQDHGIAVKGVTIDVPAMNGRKDQVVKKLTGGVAMLMKANKVTVLRGIGRVNGSGSVTVTSDSGKSETIATQSIVLATGSVPQDLPFLPFDGKTVVSSTEAIAFDSVPKKLLVVGAGAIGLELGSVWARLGSEVHVVEILPEILAGWDAQVAKTMRKELGKQGITFHLETKVTGVKVTKTGATLSATDKSGNEVSFSGNKVLVAVGRKPFTEGLNLEELDITREKGRIVVDEHYRTNVDGIYAIGDIIHGPMLAHKAEDEGVAVAEVIAGKPGHVNYDAIPNVVYTWPEAAAVGRTEEQLKSDGVSYRSGSFPFAANGRAIAMQSTAGFVKMLADEKTDRLLGVHIVGPWASDLIGEAVSVMEFGGSAEDIARTVHAHPTLSEAMKEAALGVDGRMLNSK
ncbi:MAG: dihydrolipoyl dehydrogenase [Spirochaetaceae bacterium]|nr:MAG: dihydrolipoyl dehydrogenase [Spirochaetaceae bacterium]